MLEVTVGFMLMCMGDGQFHDHGEKQVDSIQSCILLVVVKSLVS